MEDNVAILWDIENVTPSANSQFLEGLKEYTEHLGKLTVCRVYGDWTKGYLGRLSRQLSENGFELIHIPVARKNSADISLITNAVELIYQYPHITKIVLITGDADFRPLLYTLRRNGKSVHIICNSSNASEELLSLADSFKDYREIIPGEAAEEAADAAEERRVRRTKRRFRQVDSRGSVEGREEGGSEETPGLFQGSNQGKTQGARKGTVKGDRKPPVELAFRLLAEAVETMEKQRKKPGMGAVKVRLRMLNPSFDEKAFGFKSWNDFVYAARERGIIDLIEEDQAIYLKTKPKVSGEQKTPLTLAFETLLDVLDSLTREKGKDTHSLASISTRLADRNVDWTALGYKRLKDFILSAAKRDYIDVTFENGGYWVRKKKEP
ncbi:MAG: NYN domain-containing protein [Spirochaetes bacterium]|nr:NYN domain-containing protein [Spirochaetota bacterium]